MNKEEIIKRFGEEAYKKMLEQQRAYYVLYREEVKARSKKWREEHPEEVIANHQEECRKGGRGYAQKLEYLHMGLQGKRHKIRKKHGYMWREYKNIIAPKSQMHHAWRPNSADYDGLALVEADAHMHGFIDVIEILEGKITLLTEEEVKRGER